MPSLAQNTLAKLSWNLRYSLTAVFYVGSGPIVPLFTGLPIRVHLKRMPRFVYAIVALLAVVALVARAQPFVADMTHEDSFQIMEEAPYGGTNDENTTLYYASVEVPWNAWRVAVNLTGPPCVDYSLQPPGPAAGPDIDFMVAPHLPCSYYFSNFYITVVKGSGLPVPNVLCYSYGANGKYVPVLPSPIVYSCLKQP